MTPDEVEQCVLRHQPAEGARQCAKYCEGLRRERYRFPGARQPCLGLIELETVEVYRAADDSLSCEGSFHCCRVGEKGVATPGALFGGGGRKVPGQPWRGRESHASTLSACRSARHCDEVYLHCAVVLGEWRAA